jgi:catechol 2,3-dioxygenase-like lactoylglutathione lyase family enzyme
VAGVVGLHHVQLAMPPGGEDDAREFYRDLLGLDEVAKPDHLAGRGGCWFRAGDAELHLGVEDDFRPARKAHPALLVRDLDAVRRRLSEAGRGVSTDAELEGHRRIYTADPFGNRIELIERSG